MTSDDEEAKFIHLYSFEGVQNFAGIATALGCEIARVKELEVRTRGRCKEALRIKAMCSRKNIKDVERFYHVYLGWKTECFYCRITQEQIDRLFELGKVETKRNTTRGRRLELDRLKPDEDYENFENLRLACYWCNNAKSDEFSVEEFEPIARQIGAALRARLV